jgi:hypothetical protein
VAATSAIGCLIVLMQHLSLSCLPFLRPRKPNSLAFRETAPSPAFLRHPYLPIRHFASNPNESRIGTPSLVQRWIMRRLARRSLDTRSSRFAGLL